MLLNEQKKQALELYVNQFYTQQIATAIGKHIPTSQEMEIMRKQTTCITINPHPENDDSDIPHCNNQQQIGNSCNPRISNPHCNT